MLINAISEEFCSRFTKGGQVLYAGKDDPSFDEDELRRLGVSLDKYDKLPDVVIYDPDCNWLVLVQDASSHGPVDEQRYGELATLFGGVTADLVFVSCFPSRPDMRRHPADIAWETAVWCADEPDHLIHFDGKRLLGPYASGS